MYLMFYCLKHFRDCNKTYIYILRLYTDYTCMQEFLKTSCCVVSRASRPLATAYVHNDRHSGISSLSDCSIISSLIIHVRGNKQSIHSAVSYIFYESVYNVPSPHIWVRLDLMFSNRSYIACRFLIKTFSSKHLWLLLFRATFCEKILNICRQFHSWILSHLTSSESRVTYRAVIL